MFSNLFLIAWRNLTGEKSRLFVTSGGVALSVLLMLVLLGLYRGWSEQMSKFLGSLPADIWVGQKGSRDMSHTSSILSNTFKEKLEEEEGVKKVIPFVSRRMGIEVNGKETRLSLIGVNQEGMIKPYRVEKGKSLPEKEEIILDETFAQDKGLKIGQGLAIANKTFTITGISSGGYLLVYSYAFVTEEDLREIIKSPNFSNYFLLQVENTPAALRQLRERYPELEVIERNAFIETNVNVIREAFLPIIGILLVIAFLIGITVIGLTLLTATIEKSHEYGVLKAIGFDNLALFSIVLIQSLVAGSLGFIFGNLLTLITLPLAKHYVSGFMFEVGIGELTMVATVAITVSFIAAFLPIGRLASIDPAQVFKA